ncbi:zona pellucida sperm-binding protein 3 receptor-like [Watersipora subatra]|uniref:zona pellucida sperm-binding protein 3 receptor-like n=1 Tax=Watersipora subatra TaxID=2589382 RepID=UPI00355C6E9A
MGGAAELIAKTVEKYWFDDKHRSCGIPPPGDTIRPRHPQRTYLVNKFAWYDCVSGYRIKKTHNNDITSAQVSCNRVTNTPTWDPVPDGELCDAPEDGENTTPIEIQGAQSGETYTYKCKQGYATHGSLSRMCLDGSWSPTATPTCEEKCPRPPRGVNTQRRFGRVFVVGDVYSYQCLPGYFSDADDMKRECLVGGSWSLTPPQCVLKCRAPANGVNTELVDEDFRADLGDNYTYSCLKNYGSEISLTVTCQNDGSWYPASPPECVLICDAPANGTNTELVESNFRAYPGTTYEYRCLDNYESENSLRITCLNNGTWSSMTPPNCVAVCGTPEEGNNTQVVQIDGVLRFGDLYRYNCLDGFTSRDDLLIYCEEDGNWSVSTPPSCVRECAAPTNGTNTVPVFSGYRQTEGHNYQYACIKGYITRDDTITKCLTNGSWSLLVPPKCVAECGMPENGTNTEPVEKTASLTYGQSYTYSCLRGYSSNVSMLIMCNKDGNWSLDPPRCDRRLKVYRQEFGSKSSFYQHNLQGLYQFTLCLWLNLGDPEIRKGNRLVTLTHEDSEHEMSLFWDVEGILSFEIRGTILKLPAKNNHSVWMGWHKHCVAWRADDHIKWYTNILNDDNMELMSSIPSTSQTLSTGASLFVMPLFHVSDRNCSVPVDIAEFNMWQYMMSEEEVRFQTCGSKGCLASWDTLTEAGNMTVLDEVFPDCSKAPAIIRLNSNQ